MSMYKYTRQEAADLLSVSTRSIDRYIKSWKIRSKKDGKVVYVNEDDLKSLSWNNTNQEVIVEKETKSNIAVESTWVETYSNNKSWALEEIYNDLRTEIKEKDTIIRELSIRVWRAEEVAKNSVSLIDFKKSQFLLEESKSSLNQSLVDLEWDKEKLTKDLKEQKTNNMIILVALVFLFAVAATLFLLKI